MIGGFLQCNAQLRTWSWQSWHDTSRGSSVTTTVPDAPHHGAPGVAPSSWLMCTLGMVHLPNSILMGLYGTTERLTSIDPLGASCAIVFGAAKI